MVAATDSIREIRQLARPDIVAILFQNVDRVCHEL